MLYDDSPHLSYLVRLRVAAFALEVDQVIDAVPAEHVMAAANPHLEAETIEESAKILEAHVRVGCAAENLVENPVLVHEGILPWMGDARPTPI